MRIKTKNSPLEAQSNARMRRVELRSFRAEKRELCLLRVVAWILELRAREDNDAGRGRASELALGWYSGGTAQRKIAIRVDSS